MAAHIKVATVDPLINVSTMKLPDEITRGFNPGEKDCIDVNLRVPAIPPTDSASSKLIRIEYSIRV